jgi:hypothetical protein
LSVNGDAKSGVAAWKAFNPSALAGRRRPELNRMLSFADRAFPADPQASSNARNAQATAWQRGVASILETGQRLLDAKDELDRDVWRSPFQLKKLPLGDHTARIDQVVMFGGGRS